MNGGTASTSELLAGALHDAAGVPLLGEKTFGKGITQRVVNLSDGSVLLVSTATYMTPRHTPVHKVRPTLGNYKKALASCKLTSISCC